jgi:shikimate kinase
VTLVCARVRITAVTNSNIFLIGPMGAGKTTIGRQLARRLNLDFFDSDREIEKAAGVDVATIFEFEGEAGFRKRECRAIRELTQKHGIVAATGGGAILIEDNRQCLARSGTVIYLATGVEEQLRRTRHDKKRPLLHTTEPRLALQKLAELRNPLYQSIADIRISTEGRNARSVVQSLAKELQALRTV